MAISKTIRRRGRCTDRLIVDSRDDPDHQQEPDEDVDDGGDHQRRIALLLLVLDQLDLLFVGSEFHARIDPSHRELS